MIDIREKQRMGTVTTAACRSYSALTFDGCPACVGAVLDAIVQAGMFTLGRTAPGMAEQVEGPLDMEYALRVRLTDELGGELGTDEIEAEQTVSAIGIGGEEDGGTVAETDEADEDEFETEHGASMRLEDFQTVLDRLELAPAGRHGQCGVIAGHLYGFDQLIGRFEIQVAPAI
ncbi:MAG: hypothetical protein ACXWN4_00145 [Candidatus Limnocylindrales bacterium]